MAGQVCRLATAADVSALAPTFAGIARASGPSVDGSEQVAAWARFGRDTPAFRGYLPKGRTWVAKAEAQAGPLGFCGIGEENGCNGEVHTLSVCAGHTRQGWGSLLLAHALSVARGRGAQHCGAWVTPLSRPLFLRGGFEFIELVLASCEGVLFMRCRVATRSA